MIGCDALCREVSPSAVVVMKMLLMCRAERSVGERSRVRQQWEQQSNFGTWLPRGGRTQAQPHNVYRIQTCYMFKYRHVFLITAYLFFPIMSSPVATTKKALCIPPPTKSPDGNRAWKEKRDEHFGKKEPHTTATAAAGSPAVVTATITPTVASPKPSTENKHTSPKKTTTKGKKKKAESDDDDDTIPYTLSDDQAPASPPPAVKSVIVVPKPSPSSAPAPSPTPSPSRVAAPRTPAAAATKASPLPARDADADAEMVTPAKKKTSPAKRKDPPAPKKPKPVNKKRKHEKNKENEDEEEDETEDESSSSDQKSDTSDEETSDSDDEHLTQRPKKKAAGKTPTISVRGGQKRGSGLASMPEETSDKDSESDESDDVPVSQLKASAPAFPGRGRRGRRH